MMLGSGSSFAKFGKRHGGYVLNLRPGRRDGVNELTTLLSSRWFMQATTSDRVKAIVQIAKK